APKRVLEVAGFTNWLALRAFDQQTRRIDALESGQAVNLPVPGESESKTPQQPAPPRGARQPQRPRPPQPSAQNTSPAPARPQPSQPPVDLRPPASRGN